MLTPTRRGALEDRLADVSSVLDTVEGDGDCLVTAVQAWATSAPISSVVLVAEVGQGAEHRVRCRLSETAQAGVSDHCAQVLEISQILFGAPAVGDPLEQVVHLHRTRPARGALAAALIHGELHEELGDVGHADLVVHDDETAGAHDRSELTQALVVDGCVEELGRDAAAGRSTGLCSFERPSLGRRRRRCPRRSCAAMCPSVPR